MRKILIVGDSLAGGWPHQNFPRLFAKMLGDCQVIARPSGGETLVTLGERALKLVKEVVADALVLEVGTNDLLITELEERGGRWGLLARRLKRRGCIPVEDPAEFKEIYSGIVEELRRRIESIVLTTIPCIGEDLSSKLNRRRMEYNGAMVELAKERGVLVADVAERFQGYLAQHSASGGYFLDNFWGIFLDPLYCLTRKGAEMVSSKRGLLLTIDGVHLNPQGALLFAEALHQVFSTQK